MELTQNKFIVQIEKDGQLVDFTSNVFFPIKWTEILDEQLDEGVLTLVNCDVDIFKPLSRVEISLWNESAPNEVKEIVMLVSSDSAEEMPVGSGKFKHSLSIIEETKFLEGFICRSQGYVNFTKASPVSEKKTALTETRVNLSENEGTIDDFTNPYVTDPTYLTPYNLATNTGWFEPSNFPIYTPMQICKDYIDSFPIQDPEGLIDYELELETFKYYIEIKESIYPGKILNQFTAWYSWDSVTKRATLIQGEMPSAITLESANPLLIYTRTDFVCREIDNGIPAVGNVNKVFESWYRVTCEIAKEGNDWQLNARKVIERALIICETLRKGETPRFKLNEAQAIEFEKIPTPEFQFTQSTLREILQGVGNYIHGEPRLKNGEIYYDIYGSDEINDVDVEPYSSLSLSQDITQYATNLDSSVGNLVCSLEFGDGSIVEPYYDGFKTVRAETVYARVEDSNMLIETQYPINEIEKLECCINQDGNLSNPIDITNFVFERADYERMSSYYDEGLYTKSLAIYYSRGEKNILGLNFKVDVNVAVDGFASYAIANILSFAVSNGGQETAGSEGETPGGAGFQFADLYYPDLAFRVTYKPFYSARIKQSKMNISEYNKPRTLIYNQGQNIVESSFYGENLKGAVARMGNVEKSITYVRYGLPKLPKVGTLFDDDYYISTMAVEYNPFTTKVSLGLTKEFNRLSEYVGINSTKRQYEVSERQAFDSHVEYNDYVIIGDNEIIVPNENEVLFQIDSIKEIITQSGNDKKITLALAHGESNDVEARSVALPVQSVPIGNSALFVIKYLDNWAAGNSARWKEENVNGDIVEGRFLQGVNYTDIFGEIEYLNFNLVEAGPNPKESIDSTALTRIGATLPEATEFFNEEFGEQDLHRKIKISTGTKPLWIKKGNTEILNIDYQIDFVSNRDKLVVGSQMAKNLPLISGSKQGNGAKLYLLPTRLKKFAYDVDLTNARLVRNYNNGGGVSVIGNKIIFDAVPFTADGNEYNSWVMVSDVDGNTGKMLFGQNKHFNENDSDILDGLYITCKHKLF